MYKPIVTINEEERIFEINHSNGRPEINLATVFKNLPATIIDKQTLLLTQLGDLHQTMDHATTGTGSATLFRSLMQPPTSLELILAKQDSVRELESNGRLRDAITDYLREFKEGENALFKFLNEKIDFRFPYGDFRAAMKAGRNIIKSSQSIPNPESAYARTLVDEIKNFESSPVYRLMRGPIYRTFSGLKSKEDINFLTPRWRFRPTSMTLGSMGGPLTLAGLIGGTSAGLIERGMPTAPYAAGAMIWTVMGLMYGSIMKPNLDYETVIDPLWIKSISDKPFISAIDSVGKLDELISFIAYAKAMPHTTTMPTVTDGDTHYFMAQNMRNPIQAKENPEYVPNSVNLNGARLTFITGPNSGGKTTYCKSLFQNQLLGQIGSYVVASEASMNIADRMAYQAPQFDALQDEEGRFGTELKRTKDIFYATSPKSLVILDELAEGTTIEEKMQQSRIILNGFHTIGNNTIQVTHNHALVDNFRGRGVGQYLQVGFNGKTPTHRLTEGISRESHADRVAEKIGFSEMDIQKYLIEKGYTSNT